MKVDLRAEAARLAERRKKYAIPESLSLPVSKTVLVWRLPAEEKTAGGLYVPEAHADVKSRGILLAAGLKARDIMADNLIEIGDEVMFGRYAGAERDVGREAEGVANKVCELKIEDIVSTVDGAARLKDYDIEIDDEGEHGYVPKRKA